MTMRTGLKCMKNTKVINGDAISFIAEDGREMFQIKAGEDGASIEVRAVEFCRVGGVLYGSQISINPIVSNSIIVSVTPYDS